MRHFHCVHLGLTFKFIKELGSVSKGYHSIEAYGVNESNMEHAQEAIKEFHNRPTKKQRKCKV